MEKAVTVVGAALRRARRDQDVTQVDLSRRTRVRQTTISDIETGRNRNPSWQIVGCLAKELGIDLNELYAACSEAA